MDQPLDDLQDGKRDSLAFYSAPIADRVDLYVDLYEDDFSSKGSSYTIWVPRVVFEKGETVVHDHPLLKLYRNLVASIMQRAMQEADVKTQVGRDADYRESAYIGADIGFKKLAKEQRLPYVDDKPYIDDDTFNEPKLQPFAAPYRAAMQVETELYRSPKEMILSQYEVFPSNLRHPHSIVRQVVCILLNYVSQYTPLEHRTTMAAEEKASYQKQLIPKLSALFEPLCQAIKDPDAGVRFQACHALRSILKQLMAVDTKAIDLTIDLTAVQTAFHQCDYITPLKDRLLAEVEPESDKKVLDLLVGTLHTVLLYAQTICEQDIEAMQSPIFREWLLSCQELSAIHMKMETKGLRSTVEQRLFIFTDSYNHLKRTYKPSNDCEKLLLEILQTRYALYHLHNSSKKIAELLSKDDCKGIHQLLDDPYLRDPTAFTPALRRKLRGIIDQKQKRMRNLNETFTKDLALRLPKYRWSMGSLEQRGVEQAKLLEKMEEVVQCWKQERSEGLKTQGSLRRNSSSPSLKTPDLSPSIAQQASSSAQSPKPIFDSEELARLDEHEFTQCKLETLHLVEFTQLLGSQQPGPSSGLATQSPWRATEEKRKVDPAESKDGEGSYDSQQSGQAPCCSYLPTFPRTKKTSKKDLSPREAMPLSPRRQSAEEKGLPHGSVRKDSSAPTSALEAKKTADLSPGIAQQASTSARAQSPERMLRQPSRPNDYCDYKDIKLLLEEGVKPPALQQPSPSGLTSHSASMRPFPYLMTNEGGGSYDSQRSGQAPCCSYLPAFPHTKKTPKKDSSPREAMSPSPSGQGDEKSCCIS